MAIIVPKFNELMIPTLNALKQLGGSASVEELPDIIAKNLNFGDDIQSVMHLDTSRSELAYRLAWARTYLKGAGAVENSERGIWSITDFGEKITEADVEKIVRDRRAQLKSSKQSKKNDKIVYEVPLLSIGDDTQDWKLQLLEVIKNIEPAAFERLCQRILRESGFTRVEVTGKSGDGGIDGLGILRVNLVSFRVVFQSKRWKGAVGSQEVRLFQSAMLGRAEKGLIITTGTFTSEARKEATRDGAPAVDLVDGDALCELLKELKLGVKEVKNYSIEKKFFESI